MDTRHRTEPAIVVSGRDGDSSIQLAPLAGLHRLADPKRSVVIADPLTARFVPAEFRQDRVVLVERGEAAKTLRSLDSLYGRLLELGVGRDWTLVGLGGGSVSDLAGFAASTWMRGVDFGFVPTTLLAMVDASVGGKNGIDYGGYKNLVGTFNQPRFVLVDSTLLAELPEADLAGGIAEAIKHGIIEGDEHLRLIERAVARSGRIDRGALGPVIRASIALKARVAGADERESGERRRLNLGHTIGHGVEAVTGLPHGACVAAGIAAALRLAVERGGSGVDADRVIALLDRLGLPTSLEAARRASADTSELSPSMYRDAVADAMASDKKRLGEELLFVVPMAIGDTRIERIELELLREFVRRTP